MKHLRLKHPWSTMRPFHHRPSTDPDAQDIHTAPAASFQKAEAMTGLLVGAGSVAVAVPGMATTVSPVSALLLLPIATLIGYGALILTRHPPKNHTEPPLPPHQRRSIRRRTATWAVILIIALAVPLDWVWPLFVSGWIGIAFAVRQMRQQQYN